MFAGVVASDVLKECYEATIMNLNLSLKDLEQIAKKKQQTQIFMETPFRNNQLLEDILQNLNSETLLCIACNVTAEDEFIKTLRVKDWRKSKPDLHKKPTIFLLL